MNQSPPSNHRHPLTFCWPPFIVILPFVIADYLGALTPERFLEIHGYLEIAIVVGLIAAIGYSIRLWPLRHTRRFRIPLWINLGFLILIVNMGFIAFLSPRLP